MQIEKLLEEQKAKAHIHWLNRAKTAKVDGMELTVLPYGFLTQAVEKSVNEILKQFIDGLMEREGGDLKRANKELEEYFGETPYIDAKEETINYLKEIRKQLN